MAHVSDCAGTPLKEETVGFASLPLGECLSAAAPRRAAPLRPLSVIAHCGAGRKDGGGPSFLL